MIVLDSIHKSYDDGGRSIDVLRGLSLSVDRGESVAIVGPSGSGKSTLLHVVGGLDRRYRGTVTVAGRDLSKLTDRELSAFRASTVGFIFQSFNLIPTCSALENVLLPSWFASSKSRARREGESEDAFRHRAVEALARVGLEHAVDRHPGTLSGGERQRVAIARALFARPAVLLADEPTGNLDAKTGGGIIDLLAELQSEGLTLLIVTHEERMWRSAQRVVRLESGVLQTEEAA